MAGDLSNVLVSTELTILTTGWSRTEGPVWHPEGYLTFVDLEGSRLLRRTPMAGCPWSGKTPGGGQWLTLDHQGRLIMCEGADHRRITRLEPDGWVTTLVGTWQGKRFNKPNDVICRSHGTICFTDPELRLPTSSGRSDSPGCSALVGKETCTWLPMNASTPTAWPCLPTNRSST